MNTPKQIETKIFQILGDIPKKLRDSPTSRWTRVIKKEICALGEDYGFNVNPSTADGRQWLFDLIWAESKYSFFVDLPLAMECEWSLSDDDIWWDFEKLLVAKALHKLFIFNKRTDREISTLLKELAKSVRKFKTKIPVERYLLAGYCCEGDHFMFSSLSVRSSSR